MCFLHRQAFKALLTLFTAIIFVPFGTAVEAVATAVETVITAVEAVVTAVEAVEAVITAALFRTYLRRPAYCYIGSIGRPVERVEQVGQLGHVNAT